MEPTKQEKKAIHNYVASMIMKGRLVRQPCEVCGKVASQAHHEDYNNPLGITWLCHQHHYELHCKKRGWIVGRREIERTSARDVRLKRLADKAEKHLAIQETLRQRHIDSLNKRGQKRLDKYRRIYNVYKDPILYL